MRGSQRIASYIVPILLSIGVYTSAVLISRHLEIFSPLTDWLWLVACGLLPLAFSVYRRFSLVPILGLGANLVFLFVYTFWLLANVVGEGL